MVSVSYSDVQNVMNLTTSGTTGISAIDTEYLLDYAIDLLNLYGNASLDNLSGVAGSKTVTLTSPQRGAVLWVTRVIYYSFYRNITDAAISGMTVSPARLAENPVVMQTVRLAAHQLQTRSFTRT